MRSSNPEPALLRAITQTFESWLKRLVRRPRRTEQESADVDNTQPQLPTTDGESLTPHVGPPADWLARTRLEGPPAHWLELVEKAKSSASNEGAFEFEGQADGQTSAESAIQDEGTSSEHSRSSAQQVVDPNAARIHPILRAQSDTRAEYTPRPKSVERSSEAPRKEIQAVRRQEVKAEEQPSAKIHQPRRTESKKQGSEITATRRETVPPVVIKAGRTLRRSEVQREQLSPRAQKTHSLQPVPSETSNTRAKTAQPEGIAHVEQVTRQTEHIASWPQLDERSRLERPAQGRDRQSSVSIETRRLPISPGPEPNPSQVASQPRNSRFENLFAAEVPLRKRDAFQVQDSVERLDSAYWPELPDAELSDTETDVIDAARVRQHLEKLDAEQRGLEWNA